MSTTSTHLPQTFPQVVVVNSNSSRPEAKTKKVLHLINGEHYSGAERVQDLLAVRLPHFGYEVGFACLKPAKFPKVRQSVDSPLFEIPMRHRLDLRAVDHVVKLCRLHDYSILHAHTPRTLLVGRLAVARLGCPLVYHVHSPVGRDSNKGISNRINTMLEKWSLKKARKLICVSGSLADYMRELGVPAEKLVVVRNGVSCVEGVPVRTAPQTNWTIGVMALFRPRKGTEVLLDAIQLLRQRNILVRLRAVGPFETPEYEREIMDRVDRLGIADLIEWTGFQVNVNEQFAKMDLFVLPSLYGEGLPMVVLEAMANRVPVVASRVEGIPEAVRDEVDGLIFEPNKPDDLANKLQALIGDSVRWESMSQSAFDRQRSDLSDFSMAQGVAQVYDSCS